VLEKEKIVICDEQLVVEEDPMRENERLMKINITTSQSTMKY
jgi:hypothetical protein